MAYIPTPIDRAHSCITQLRAITGLLCAVNLGDLHMVKAGDLAGLLDRITDDLDAAMDDLNKRNAPKPLKAV